MERRTAAAIALSVTATVLASGAAFAANVGLLDPSPDPVGQLEVSNVSDLGPTTTLAGSTTPQTIVIDVPVGNDDHRSDSDDDADRDGSDGADDQPTTTTVGGATAPGDPTTTTVTGATPSTLDDHGGDDDHPEDGPGHDDEDRGQDDDD